MNDDADGSTAGGPVGRILRGADDVLLRVRDSMTPGQRWTSGLALVLVIFVIRFGAPTTTLIAPAGAPSGTPQHGSAPTGSRTAPPADRPAATSGFPTSARGAVPSRVTEVGAASEQDPGPADAVPPDAGEAPTSVRAVALVPVPEEDGPAPGRGEADVAGVFVGDASYSLRLVEIPAGEAGTCTDVVGSRNVALVSVSLVPAFRDCLVGAGVAVVAFDPAGDQPAEGESGRVLSTRRGVVDTLTDLGRWGAGGPLDGRVGVVSTVRRQESVGTAVGELRGMGVDVEATAYLDSGGTTSDGVRSFVEAGVEVVLFAAPVEQQSRWASQHTILDPGVRFVVSDVDDGVREETYAPSFDGALAHTSLRMPWYSREHGETDEQAACREQWEASATPPTTLGSEELGWVYEWCQHVELVGTATAEANGERPVGALLRDVRLTSPLTSDLGPLPDGRYGPTSDAVLVWRASCSCWEERRGFRPRGG